MSKDIELFIDKFVSELHEENAAIFAGAGLSVAAGYVNWKELLRPIAKKLCLEIDKEHDLVSLAQYCSNEVGGRHELNEVLLNHFCKGHIITENHKILARLPIKNFWTTNYDPLIEDSLTDAHKIPDVKFTIPHLTQTIKNRDATVYKMHGDRNHVDSAIINKDDYEKYHQTHSPFITALSGDLTSKTFLFLGFSFSDPNLDYILSRIRISFKHNQRPHYCIFREITRDDYDNDADFEYNQKKQQLAVKDLERFNIKTLLIKSYEDITLILKRIESKYRQNTIFISGSASEYGKYKKEPSELFLCGLGKRLMAEHYKLVSGFGLGVGSHIITGSLEEIYFKQGKKITDQLIIRPFPQGENAKQQWKNYRKDMISRAGVAIFVFGNKLDKDNIINAGGVQEEFDIAKEEGLKIIPVGATGFMAKVLWDEVMNNFAMYYPDNPPKMKKLFEQLGDENQNLDVHIDTVLQILKLLKEENYNGA